MKSLRRLAVVLLVPASLALACSSDDEGKASAPVTTTDGGGTGGGTDGGSTGGAGTGGATSVPDSGGAVTDGPLDCSASKWGTVSPACFECMCTACKPKLDLCNGDCLDILACAVEKDTLVGASSELPCEISGTAQLCLQVVSRQPQAQALVNLDLCLISAKKTSGFRICEAECGIAYTGTVCDRFPQTPAQ